VQIYCKTIISPLGEIRKGAKNTVYAQLLVFGVPLFRLWCRIVVKYKTINRKGLKVSAKFTKISKSIFYLCGLGVTFVSFAVKRIYKQPAILNISEAVLSVSIAARKL